MCKMGERFPAEGMGVKIAGVKHRSAFWKLQERQRGLKRGSRVRSRRFLGESVEPWKVLITRARQMRGK